jgi:AmmeMemoRadiSam system protein B
MEVSMRVREPAVAGMFYPGSRTELAASVDRYLADAQSPVLDGLDRVRAVIAPHAGYIYSGPTAGFAFKALQGSLPAGEATIYCLAPAHRVWYDGLSTGDFESFATPLGSVPVDQERVRALWETGPLYQAAPAAHQGEHSLEVQLPFLQRISDHFFLVPLLFGEVDACVVGRELAGRLQDEPDARVVVSSDLSHFERYKTAQRKDQAFLQDLLAGDGRAVEANRRGACGYRPISALIEMATRLGWTPHLLDYRNSGDTAGDKGRVVGYAAVAYTSGD